MPSSNPSFYSFFFFFVFLQTYSIFFVYIKKISFNYALDHKNPRTGPDEMIPTYKESSSKPQRAWAYILDCLYLRDHNWREHYTHMWKPASIVTTWPLVWPSKVVSKTKRSRSNQPPQIALRKQHYSHWPILDSLAQRTVNL